MASNPRKFSEKIALMRAKEAEADAAFHQILNEVSGITKAPEPVSMFCFYYFFYIFYLNLRVISCYSIVVVKKNNIVSIIIKTIQFY